MVLVFVDVSFGAPKIFIPRFLANLTTINKFIAFSSDNCIILLFFHLNLDNVEETSFATSPLFMMSGDGLNDVNIPVLFLFGKEGKELILAYTFQKTKDVYVFMGDNSMRRGLSGIERALTFTPNQFKLMFNGRRYSKLFVCDKSEYYLNLTKQEKAPSAVSDDMCKSSDALEFAQVYNNVYRLDSKSHRPISVQLDDVITIEYVSEKKKHLVLNLESFLRQDLLMAKNESSSNEAQKLHDKANRVFKLLLDHFHARTSLLKFRNVQAYVKSLFNYVNSQVNPGQGRFSVQDRRIFELLANELDEL